MSVLYFETFGKPAASVSGAERFHLLGLVRTEAARLGADVGPPVESLLDQAAANVCLAHGPDALRLAVRLAAQAELHCWVDGPNRRWLAWLIGAALEAGYFRQSMGWERVQAFLLAGDQAAVFCSTSITEPMPSRELALATGLLPAEDYEPLPDVEKWGLVELFVRYESALEDKAAGSETFTAPMSRELRPGNWSDYFLAV